MGCLEEIMVRSDSYEFQEVCLGSQDAVDFSKSALLFESSIEDCLQTKRGILTKFWVVVAIIVSDKRAKFYLNRFGRF